MLSPQQEVVLDGELSLNLNMDGEAGTVIKVVERDAPTYQGQTTVDPNFSGTVLDVYYISSYRPLTLGAIPDGDVHGQDW